MRITDTPRAFRALARSGLLAPARPDRLWRAAINSWNGLRAVVRSEEAFRQELIVLVISAPLAFLVATTAWRRLTLVLVIVLIMIVELLNTNGVRITFESVLEQAGSAAIGRPHVARALIAEGWAVESAMVDQHGAAVVDDLCVLLHLHQAAAEEGPGS